MFQDLKFGLKLLWKQKAFTLAALTTLALCIGANTAIFTVLDVVVLRGLPFREADRLVSIYNIYPGVGLGDFGSNAAPDLADRRKLTDVFNEVALYTGSGYDVGMEGSPQRIDGLQASPAFFKILGVQTRLGRTFTEEEATPGKNRVAILSHGLWNDMFGRDPKVLEKDIRLSGNPFRIVGVMPEGFEFPGIRARIWVPLALNPQQLSDDGRHSNNWNMIARLQPGVPIAKAQQRIDMLNKENLDRFPRYKALLESSRFATKVVGLKEEIVREIRDTLFLLQAAVAAVLLIGCVNLANLMLVRSNVRMKELAIRFSLGAGRQRLGRQLLTESVTLALLGGALGVLVGYGGLRLFSSLGANELPRGASIQLDGTVLAFTAGVAVLTGLVFGSIPLVNLFRRDLNDAFRQTERSGTMGRHAAWLRSILVVCQVSLAFVLLVASGLLTFSFLRLLNVNPGFRPDHVYTARIALPNIRYRDDAVTRNFIAGFLDRIRAIPGVKHAGTTTFLPFGGSANASVIMIKGRPLAPGENPPVPGWNNIDSGYFAAMGIPLLEGRVFSDADTAEAPKVTLIDEFLAKKYWPNGGAIGQGIQRGLGGGQVFTVIGVVGSVKSRDLADQKPGGQVFFHFKQITPRGMHLVLRTERDDPHVIAAVRREIMKADPELPLFDAKTMQERISDSLTTRRAAMVLCLAFGGLALLLAAVGIYGVLAYAVAQRTREFGIRVALGATTRDVVRMVLGEGARLAVVGLVIGVGGALATTRLMSTMLHDIKPTDVRVFVLGAAVLGSVAMIAMLIPSLRAVRIRPASALRHE